MARIDLDHIRHSYLRNPTKDSDFALKEVHQSFEDGGAYAHSTTILGALMR